MTEETPSRQRRYIEREYPRCIIKKLFEIDDNEMVLDFYLNKDRNRFVIKTLKECDYKKGDI